MMHKWWTISASFQKPGRPWICRELLITHCCTLRPESSLYGKLLRMTTWCTLSDAQMNIICRCTLTSSFWKQKHFSIKVRNHSHTRWSVQQTPLSTDPSWQPHSWLLLASLLFYTLKESLCDWVLLGLCDFVLSAPGCTASLHTDHHDQLGSVYEFM